MLETAPSFSIYSKIEAEDDKEKDSTKLITAVQGGGDFSFVKPKTMDLIKEEVDDVNELDDLVDGFDKLGTEEVGPSASPPMYLAAGFGMRHDDANFFGEEKEISEEYCRELLEEYPNHPLILKKYAEVLLGKGDLEGAEEYYFRAAQADPTDGETLSQCAKLVWELSHDQERALTYFDLAAQAAPSDSNVMAAYAKFLWETDDGAEEESVRADYTQLPEKSFELYTTDDISADSQGVGGGSCAPTSDVTGPIEIVESGSYYKKMVDENPSHPIFLKKYAQFLYESKGDLQGAEEYYSRALLADPKDGEMLSQYASLIWDLHHDQDRTLSYLEQAIQAAPQDSNVLAAYARIMWAIDDE